MQWNRDYIDLENLISLSRGDNNQMLKYLNQFLELMPCRVEILKNSLEEEDRKKVRQVLHQMSPQLQFFGVPDILTPIRRLEHEYETMPIENLKTLVKEILIKLDHARIEVALVLKNYF